MPNKHYGLVLCRALKMKGSVLVMISVGVIEKAGK